MIGSTLSHFRITAKLGEGGMGTVYRAEDTKLGREVAVKVLPEAFVADPERLGRFEREAKVLASLNHPNIAGIHEVGEQDDTHFLVMELAPGETMADRIARGPMPGDEAVAVAAQIARGLEAAHERGVVHRDLKPGNVMVDERGGVKILDFGLAKALAPEPGSDAAAELAHSPTLTYQATVAGALLGTAAYMSPEQARGQAADRRADIWSFGVVLWEMLTGRRLFQGATTSDTLAGILRDEIDTSKLPPDCPPTLRRLLGRCLERDPDRRLHDVADARIELEDFDRGELDFGLAGSPASAAAAGRAPRIALAAAVIVGLALGAAAVWMGRPATQVEGTTTSQPVRAGLHPPLGVTVFFESSGPGPMTLSPDGSKVVFGGVRDDRTIRLYVQDLATGSTTELPDTDGAQYPFWSPNGAWIGYFTQVEATLKKVAAAGGPPITIAPAEDGKGGSWGQDDTIVFAPIYSSALWAVSANGGDPRPVTEIDPERHNSHRHPRFLPDGRRFLYLARSDDPARSSDIVLGSLDGGEPRVVLSSQSQVELAGDQILFVRERVLFTQSFDPAASEPLGSPTPITGDVAVETGASFAAFSATERLLVYHSGDLANLRKAPVERRARDGTVIAKVGAPADYWQLALAPDHRRLAVSASGTNAGLAIYLLDLERGDLTRLTEAAGDQFFAVWAPDGETLYFASNQNLRFATYALDLRTRESPELLYELPGIDVIPTSVSPDGQSLVFLRRQEADLTLWALPLDGGEPWPLLGDEQAYYGRISPDGRWFVYQSGSREIFVTRYPEPARRHRVSTDGGSYPLWSPEGDEILYVHADGRVRAASFAVENGEPRLDPPEALFSVANKGHADVVPATPLPGSEEFLVIPSSEASEGAVRANLIVDWRAGLGGE